MKCQISQNKAVKFRNALIDSPLRWVQFWVTEKCQLACTYCSSHKNTSKDPSLDILEERIKKLGKVGVGMISLFGGEPTLRPDLPELVAKVNSIGAISYIATNGMFSPEYLGKLGAQDIDVIHVSADYYDKTGSQRQRDKKYLDPKQLAMLLEGRDKFGYQFWLNVCVTRDNRDHVDSLLQITKENDIHTVIRPAVRDIKPLSSTRVKDSTFLHPNEIIELAKYCIEKRRQGSPLSSPNDYFQHLISSALGEDLTWKCGSGKLFLVVNIYGDIMPCSEIHVPTSINLDSLDINSIDEHSMSPARIEILQDTLPACNHKCTQITPFCTTHYADRYGSLDYIPAIKDFAQLFVNKVS